MLSTLHDARTEMSLLLLPDEILDAIFSFVHDKTCEPTRDSQNTFASLALTSKRLISLARSHLYWRPIGAEYVERADWDNALLLFESLSTPLGQFVISLAGIADLFAALSKTRGPDSVLPFQLRGYTKAYSFYIALIGVCPRIARVDLLLETSRQLSKMLNALDHVASTLKTVHFGGGLRWWMYPINVGFVCTVLQRPTMRGIENVIVKGGALEGQIENRVDITLKSLRLEHGNNGRKFPLESVLPAQCPSLESFHFAVRYHYKNEFEAGLDHVPVTLQRLTMRYLEERIADPPVIDEYFEIDCALPAPSKWAHLTSLTHLSLQNFDGPSISLLESLSSLSIIDLDFAGCKWVPTSRRTASIQKAASIVDPGELIAALRKFRSLRRVHLGYLPTFSRKPYAGLADLSIKVEFGVCVRLPRCPDCGYRHW
ncbi:hypothetical protein JCM3766R1_000932 [Sporobolomyces carnicolor]